MRKFIKVAPEDEDALWNLFAEGIGRVIDLGNGFYQIDEYDLNYIRERKIRFEIVRLEEWRWKDGWPVEKFIETSRDE
jgi:hypothetical protein